MCTQEVRMRSRLWDLARNRRVLQCYQTRDVVRGQGHVGIRRVKCPHCGSSQYSIS
ncbi:hypothetical protein HanIR_Chr07g0305441 [Helianthus annuus]|nr:hypothetical protein HanIR_Chr07g0305441 [Helianthus annuus]